jgi:hypothetical protein
MPQTNRTPDFGSLFYTAKRMICHFCFHPIGAGKPRHSAFFNPRAMKQVSFFAPRISPIFLVWTARPVL